MQSTPTAEQIEAAIAAGRLAARNAEASRVRERGHRRPSRAANLRAELQACQEAALALRRYIGMVFAHDLAEDDELAMKRTLKVLEGERRKLRKML